MLKGWEVNTFGQAPDGTWLATTGSSWYGAAVHRSEDLTNWMQMVDGPSYEGAPDDRKLERIWTLAVAGDVLYAGVAEAGLFRSETGGASWEPVTGFNEHRTRSGWQPGFGGLAAHRILIDPADHSRMWVGASAVGVFRTEDGGDSWDLFNDGVETAGPERRTSRRSASASTAWWPTRRPRPHLASGPHGSVPHQRRRRQLGADRGGSPRPASVSPSTVTR